jgi:hypothetical protein
MQTMAKGNAGICVRPAWKELIATVTDVCVSDAVALFATCSLTELMFVASTHSATAVPRIQRIGQWRASGCPQSSSVHAPGDLNVQRRPYSARPLGHFAADSSRPFRLMSSLQVRKKSLSPINYFATLGQGAF